VSHVHPNCHPNFLPGYPSVSGALATVEGELSVKVEDPWLDLVHLKNNADKDMMNKVNNQISHFHLMKMTQPLYLPADRWP
jgi:hypothetical protein